MEREDREPGADEPLLADDDPLAFFGELPLVFALDALDFVDFEPALEAVAFEPDDFVPEDFDDEVDLFADEADDFFDEDPEPELFELPDFDPFLEDEPDFPDDPFELPLIDRVDLDDDDDDLLEDDFFVVGINVSSV